MPIVYHGSTKKTTYYNATYSVIITAITLGYSKIVQYRRLAMANLAILQDVEIFDKKRYGEYLLKTLISH